MAITLDTTILPLDRNNQPIKETGITLNIFGNKPSSFKGETSTYTKADDFDFPLYKGQDNEETRAQNQSTLGLIGKSIWNAADEVALGTMEGIGYLFDWQDIFQQSAAKEDGFTNQFSDIFKNLNKQTKFDIHQTNAAQDDNFWNNLTDGTWWASNAESIATTLSLIVPTFGAVKGLSMLGEATKIGSLIKSANTANAIKGIAGAVISRKMESIMEAQQTFDSEYQTLKSRGFDDNTARKVAGEAAAKNYRYNWLMLAQDIPQYMFLMGAFGKVKKALSGVKLGSKGELALNIAGEGGEELYQAGSSKEAQFQAERDSKINEENSTFGDRLKDYLTDQDNWSQAFWGAAGGGVYEGVSIYRDSQLKKEMKKRAESFKKLMTENDLKYDTPEALNKMQDADFTSLISSAFSTGNIEGLKSDLTKMKEEDNEVIQNSTSTDPKTFREKLDKRLKDIEGFETVARQVTDDRTLSPDLKRYKFTTLVAQKYAEDQLKDINKQLLSLHADESLLMDHDLLELKKAKFAYEAAKVNPNEQKNLPEYKKKLDQQYESILTSLDFYPDLKTKDDIDKAIRTSNDANIFLLSYYNQITHFQLSGLKNELSKIDSKSGRKKIEEDLNELRKKKEEETKKTDEGVKPTGEVIEKTTTGEKYNLVQEDTTPEGERVWTVMDNDGNASQVKESDSYSKKGENKTPFDPKNTREALESPDMFSHMFKWRPDKEGETKINEILSTPNWRDRVGISVSRAYSSTNTGKIFRANPNKPVGVQERTDVDVKLTFDGVPIFDLHNPNKFVDQNGKKIDFSRMTARDFYSMFYFGEAKTGTEYKDNGTSKAFEQLRRDWTALNDFNNAVVTWYQQQKIADPTKWVQLPKGAVDIFLRGKLDLLKVEEDRPTLDEVPAFTVNGSYVVWDNKLGKFVSGEDIGTEVYNKGYAPDSIFKTEEEKEAFNGKMALAQLPNGIQKWIKVVPKTLRSADAEEVVGDIKDITRELTSYGLERKENNEYKNVADRLRDKYFIAMKPGWNAFFHIIPAIASRGLEAILVISIEEGGQESKRSTIFLKGIESLDDLLAQLNSKHNKSGFTFKKTSFKVNTEKEDSFDPKKYESTVSKNIITAPTLNFTYHPEVLIKASGLPTNVLPWDQASFEGEDLSGLPAEFAGLVNEVEDEVLATDLNDLLKTEEKPTEDKNTKIIEDSLKKGVNEDPLFSIGQYVPTISNRIDYNASLEYLKGILPSFIKVREMEEKVANMAKYGVPFGALYQNAIYLSKNAPLGTQYHEAFHAVFRNFLNDTQIQATLNVERTAGKVLESEVLAQKLNHPTYTRKQLEELVLEERLADKFKAWKLNKDSQKSSLLRTIFDRIQRFIDWITGAKPNEFEQLFRKIDAGKFRNSSIVDNQFSLLGTEPVYSLLGPLGARKSNLIVATITGKFIKAREKNSNVKIEDIIKQQAEFNSPTNPINKDIIKDPSAADRLDLMHKIFLHPEIQKVIMDQVVKKMKYLGYNPVLEYQDDFTDNEQSLRNFEIAEWEYNPYDRVAAETRIFLATTLVKDIDEFGREYERAINDYQVYSSMSVLLTGKEHNQMIPTLLKFSKYKPDTKAVVDRLINETGWSEDSPEGNGTLDAQQQLTRFYKAFEREKVNWTYTEYSAAKGLRSYEAQRNKLEDDVINDWHKVYQSLSINKKAFLTGIEAFKKKLNNPKLNVEGLDNRMSLQNNLALLLQSVGITLTPGYIATSFKFEEGTDIEELEHPITLDDLDILSDKIAKGYNPFIGETEIGDYGMQSILKAWALNDLKFREDFFLKSFQDAENHNRFTYTLPSYALTKAREIKEENTTFSGIEHQKANSEEYALNPLVLGRSLVDIVDIFKNADLSIIGDYSVTKDKDGFTSRDEAVTYKSTNDRSLLLSILSSFATETKKTFKDKHGSREVTYVNYALGVNETKKAFFSVKLPVNHTYFSNKEISDKALDIIFDSIFVGEVQMLNSGKRLANRNFAYLPIFSKNFLEDVLKADLIYDKNGNVTGIQKIGNTDYNSYKETVKGLIKDYLNEEISKYKQILSDFRAESILSRSIESHGSFDTFIGNYVVNNFISVTGYNKLLRGDAKIYKNFTDWVKRGAGLVAASSSQKGRNINYVIVKDSKYTVDEKIEKDAPLRDSDDGQVVGTVDHLIEFLRTQGQLTDKKLEILNKIKNPKPGWSPSKEELKEVDLISIKDVTYGKNKDNEYVYFKDSTVIYTKLADSFYNFDKKRWEAIPGKEAWRNKREFMEKHSIHQIIPESAVKSMKTNPEFVLDPSMFHQSAEDFDKSIKDKALIDLASVFTVDGKYQGKQVENETKNSDLVILGTQLQTLIDSEIQDLELRDKYYNNLNKIHQTAFKLALNQLVTESYEKKEDISKFLDAIRENIEETTPDIHLLHFMKSVNGDMLGDPNLPHITNKFQQYFFAHISKILKTKFKGDKKTIVASNGYNIVYDNVEQRVISSDEIIKRINNGEKFPEERFTKRRLSVIFKDNGDIDYIEVVATRRSAALFGATLGEIKEIDPKLIEGIGTRIPTDSHHSMMRYKVVEYLPEYYGSTIMTAPERLRLAGEDMDIDSIFTYTYDFYLKNGIPTLFGTAKTDEEKWEEFKQYQLLRNKDLRSAFADNLEVAAVLLGGLPALKELGLPSTFKEYQEAGLPENIGALQNEVLDIYQEMLQKPEVQESLKTATDTTEMGVIADNIYTNLRGKSKESDSFSTPSGLYNSWKNITTGSENIGIAALSNTTSATLTKYKVNLRPGFELHFNKEYNSFDSDPQTTRQKNKNIGMTLNAMADNAKDPIAFYANLPFETFGLFTPMLALGVPMKTAMLFMNQPLMDEFIYRLRTGEKKFSIITELKSRYPKSEEKSIQLKDEDMELAIQSNRVKEGLSKEQKKKIDEVQWKVFQQFLRLDAISQNFQQVGNLLSINRGLGASFEAMDAINDSMDKLDVTHKLSNYERKTTLSFDFNKVIRNNSLVRGNIDIFKNTLKAFENYSIRATTPYKEIYSELSKSIKSNLKKSQKEQAKGDLMTYLTMKTFIKHFKIDTDKYNKLLKSGDTSIVKQYRDLTAKEEFKRNRFIQWLRAVPIYLEQAGHTVVNPNNKTNLELLVSDSRLKINADIQENIINAFEHLQKTEDPEIKAFMRNLIPYLLVKDNLTFRNRSFIKFISPAMFAQEGRADSLANVLKDLNKAFKVNDSDKIRELTGLSKQELAKDFIEIFSRHIRNTRIVKSLRDAANPKANIYKTGSNYVYSVANQKGILSISLDTNITKTGQLGGNTTFDIEESKNGQILKVLYPDFFMATYFDSIEQRNYLTLYRKIKDDGKSAVYQQSSQFGNFAQMPYHMSVQQLEAEKKEQQDTSEIDDYGDFNETVLNDELDISSEFDDMNTAYSEVQELDDLIKDNETLPETKKEDFPFKQISDEDINDLPNDITPC